MENPIYKWMIAVPPFEGNHHMGRVAPFFPVEDKRNQETTGRKYQHHSYVGIVCEISCVTGYKL